MPREGWKRVLCLPIRYPQVGSEFYLNGAYYLAGKGQEWWFGWFSEKGCFDHSRGVITGMELHAAMDCAEGIIIDDLRRKLELG